MMLDCWQTKPANRPTFTDLCQRLVAQTPTAPEWADDPEFCSSSVTSCSRLNILSHVPFHLGSHSQKLRLKWCSYKVLSCLFYPYSI